MVLCFECRTSLKIILDNILWVVSGCPISNMVMEHHGGGHSAGSAPNEDHHQAVAAVIRKPPPDWKQPSGRPNHTRLRAIEPDLSETTEHPLENTGVQLWTWLRSRRVCHEDREDAPCNMRRQIGWWCCDTSTDHTCNEVCCAFARLSWLRTDSSSALSESTTSFRLRAWLVAESTPCWLSCTSRSSRSIWQHKYQTDWLRFYIPLDTK